MSKKMVELHIGLLKLVCALFTNMVHVSQMEFFPSTSYGENM